MASSTLAYYYLVMFLYLHACTARVLLMVSDKQSLPQLSTMDHVETYESWRLNDQKLSSVQQAGENFEGKKIKISYAWKILHQPTGSEISKRELNERLMVESSSSRSNAEENVSSKEKENKVEDVEVMDYAQPHRKPPIHNKGT